MKKALQFLNKFPFLTTALILFCICLVLFKPTDPDLFWHIKYAETTAKSGPISTNNFSTLFPDYKFYDYQWLSHFFMSYLVKNNTFLLALILGVITLLAFWIGLNSNSKFKFLKSPIKFASLLFCLMMSSSIIGIRLQMISLLFFSLTLLVLNRFFETNSKIIFTLPFLILIWTNLHPGFLSGLLLVAIYFIFSFFKLLLLILKKENKEKKNEVKNILTLTYVTIASLFTTLINPFSYKLIYQAIEYSLDPFSKFFIIEWLAPNFNKTFGGLTIIYAIVSFALILKFCNFKKAFASFIFLLLFFSSVRHFPFYLIFTFSDLITIKKPNSIWRYFQKALIIDLLVFIISIILTINLTSEFYFSNKSFNNAFLFAGYPVNATKFLKEHEIEGNLFNDFGWGGYLIFDYDKKPFIDGRMTSWVFNKKRALEIYAKIYLLRDKDWDKSLEDYNITKVLVLPNSALANALRKLPDWEIVFEDEISVLFYKKSKNQIK